MSVTTAVPAGSGAMEDRFQPPLARLMIYGRGRPGLTSLQPAAQSPPEGVSSTASSPAPVPLGGSCRSHFVPVQRAA